MTIIYHCDFLKGGLHFTPDCFKCCCSPQNGIYMGMRYMTLDDAYEYFNKMREDAIENLKNHIAPKNCEGCMYLKEYELESDDTPKHIIANLNKKQMINNIIINHFTQCDCVCSYCSQKAYLKIVDKPEKSYFYDLLPILKNFYKNNLIDTKNLEVEFQGGSMAMLLEFRDLFNLILENGVRQVRFFTNGLKFLPEIVKASKKASIMVICSVDAGTPSTFKKIKNVDKFNDVMKNLEKYSKECIQPFQSEISFQYINAKYILLDGINDNKEELSKFINAIAKAGVNMAQLDIDYNNIMMKRGVHYDIPQHYYELFDYFKTRLAELGIRSYVWEYTQNVLDKGYFE